ncbi:chemotaxis protein CheB [Pedobacter sp. JY14-1]|uniref:chemotaxis protein CheB n=1 Tax=Pedobacter sp. JY14-1 TaxID=3034151 RepID=UPI0023E20B53|nr:chemotaxis protein CheB [Pedobacter sp. JY14-1]
MASDQLQVTAIGCSAGCLKAIGDFFQHIPTDTSMAFIVVQHLWREHRSELDHLLRKSTKLPIVRVTKSTRIEPGKIYLIIEDTYIEVLDGQIIPSQRPTEPLNRAVDVLFESLATQYRENALAIVMSGMGSDGLAGAKALAEVGGIVYVQDPETTEYKGMPNATISGDHPQAVSAPAELAKIIVQKTKPILPAQKAQNMEKSE